MRTLLCSIVTLLSFSTLFSQEIGTVRGKIYDDSAFELFGASIYEKISDEGTETDLDGSFELELAAGTYTLIAEYIGYDDKVFENVVVTAGSVTNLGDIIMETGVVMVGGEDDSLKVEVTAVRKKKSASYIVEKRKNDVNATDGISSQTFKETGASDAGDAMKQVVGVSVEGGKNVVVRGLGDRYSKTILNGANIPGLDPDKNAVQMDLFPTNLIDNIIVSKTFSPDLAGDFSGGLVNVVTKDFPEAFSLEAGLSLGYRTNTTFNDDYLSYDGSGTDFLGFDDGKRAAPSTSNVTLTKEESSKFNNQWAPEKSDNTLNHGFNFSIGNQHKVFGKKFGYIGGLTYARDFSGFEGGAVNRYNGAFLNESKTFTRARGTDEATWGALWNGSISLNAQNKLSLLLMANQSAEKSASYTSGLYVEREDDINEQRTLDFQEKALRTAQLRGKHSIKENKVEVDWTLSSAKSKLDRPDLTFFNNFKDDEGNIEIFAATDIDPTKFYRNMEQSNYQGLINGKYNFKQWNDLKAFAKIGAAVDMKERNFEDKTYLFKLVGTNELTGTVDNYLGEDNLFSNNPNGVQGTDRSEDLNKYEANQMVGSGYAMLTLPITEQYKLVGGARAEYTDLKFTGTNRNSDVFDNEQFIDNLNILPALGFIYSPNKKINVRANYSQTLARPTFKEIAPTNLYDVIRTANVNGNENLEITDIANYDVRFEYFWEGADLISTSLFYKDFTNPIEFGVLSGAGASENPDYTYFNAPEASVYGIEFEIRKGLDFINDAFDKFEVGTNFSIIKSEVEYTDEVFESRNNANELIEKTRPLYGQSPYIVNAFINYKGDKGTKANLNFNVQGKRLSAISQEGTPDIYENPYPTLGFKVSQQLSDQFSLSLKTKSGISFKEGDRLFDPERSFVYDEDQIKDGELDEYVYSSYRKGATFSLGLSYKFVPKNDRTKVIEAQMAEENL